MTDEDIAATTGVGVSTFHRWRRGDFKQAPELGRVRAFCRGLGEDPTEALTALGMQPGRDNPEPEPALPQSIRVILRALADPNVPDRDKQMLSEFLQMAADRARTMRRDERRAG